MRNFFVASFLSLLSVCCFAQTYTPSAHVQVNDAVAPAQPTPLEARSMFYDGTNFVYRAFQSTSEVLSYLNTTASRTGNFIIIVDSGGTLQGNGTYLNPHNTFYMFADSTTSGQLKKLNLFGSGVGTCSGCLLVANNLSDVASLATTLINLNLNNVNNTSDATKNAATVSLTNHTIDGTLNTLINIPNSALANKTIGLTATSLSGSDINVSTTPAALGTSLVINFPSAGTSSRGPLSAANWNFFDGKLDSVHISNDSVYNCVNGVCTLQSVVTSFGAVDAVNPANGSLIFAPSTGFVLGSVNPAYDFTWSGQHTFTGFAPIFSSLTTNGGVFYGNSFGQLLQTGGGTSGQILQSNGGAPPNFFTVNAATVDGWLGYTPLTAALPSSQIFVGNASNVATAVTASGDWTISNTGVATLKNTGPGAGSCAGCNLTLDAQGRVTAYAPGVGDSAIIADFGILKHVSGKNIRLLTDTTLSYFMYNVVSGLNDKIVGDGNSNSVGYPRGIDSSYPTLTFNLLGQSPAGWTLDVLGVAGQTTQNMIANAPTVVDTAYDPAKSVNYLPSWEVENDISENNVTATVAQTHMNTYWTDRNLVGWRTIGATALPKGDGFNNFDSVQVAVTDSANLLLIASHTSDLFINFRGNPWLNNNMSRAGFLGDRIHMNSSGTQEMADSFALKLKNDLGQPAMPVPAHPVFWNGNYTDRNMIIGPTTPFGVSLMANNMPAFDVTQFGGIQYIGRKYAEGNGANNVGFWMLPSFWNPTGYTGVTNYDLGINAESQWFSTDNEKVAFFNPGAGGSGIVNFGIGNDVFAGVPVGQTATFGNTGVGSHIFQTPGMAGFNTFIGEFSADAHTSAQNIFVSAGLNVGAIGAQNTWVGAQGSISSGVSGSLTFGFANTITTSNALVFGNSSSISGSGHEGGSIGIGINRNDGGFHSILIGNVGSEIFGTAPTADGQAIIGDIYNPDGKAIKYFSLAGNQAVNNTISSTFAPVTLTTAGIAAGGSNTNLSAAAAPFQIYGAIGTGNAASGDLVFGTGQATTSGTARQSIVKMLRVGADQTVDIGEPATHPYGTNINTSVGLNPDSVASIAPVSTTQQLVVDVTSKKVNRIPLNGVLAKNDLTAQSSAVATVTSYAVPGSGSFNTFRVGGYVTVTAISVSSLQLQVTYTDETSTSRTQSFFVQGTTSAISATGANGYSPIDIRVKQGTTITVSTAMTGVSATYDVGGSIIQLY